MNSEYVYSYDAEKCWYRANCQNYETKLCSASCIRYMEMHFLMESGNIPFNRQFPVDLIPEKVDVKSFDRLNDIKANILEFVSYGDNLYIHSSNFGNGKTTWALKLLHKYFDEIWIGNGFRCRGIFINVPHFLTKIRETISYKDDKFELMKSRLATVDLVVWDDIAAFKLSDYDHSQLLSYIDQRKLNSMANIYTGNLSGNELKDALGNRLTSRVFNDSVVIELKGQDRRGGKW